MSRQLKGPRPAVRNLNKLVDEVAMNLWNALTDAPGYDHLLPRHFAVFYEAVRKSLYPLIEKKYLKAFDDRHRRTP